jgi:hypothetical protein
MSMPVGLGSGQTDGGRRVIAPARLASPRGFNPLALWIAAASPVAATLLLITRLAV